MGLPNLVDSTGIVQDALVVVVLPASMCHTDVSFFQREFSGINLTPSDDFYARSYHL